MVGLTPSSSASSRTGGSRSPGVSCPLRTPGLHAGGYLLGAGPLRAISYQYVHNLYCNIVSGAAAGARDGCGRPAGASGRGYPAGAFSAEARLIHAGTERSGDAPVTPPLVPASIYVSQGPPRQERSYGRQGNPGWEALEQALGVLEDADAVAFASGQAASMALMLTLAESRERIVLPADGYYGARVLADKLRPHGAVPVHVDQQDLAAVARELKAAPSVLWAETPTNPLLRVADLAGLAEAAAAAQAPMVVDNTTATGLLQRPLDWGAAASLYSLTKAISGHSDVIAGAVVSRDA